MSAWHDRVVDLTLFEALTGGAFDRQNGNIAGNLIKIFQKSQMPRGLPWRGGWAVLESTGTLADMLEKSTSDWITRGKPARKNMYYHYSAFLNSRLDLFQA